MRVAVGSARTGVTLLLLLLLILVGCGRGTQSGADTGGDVQIALQPTSQDTTLVVVLTDAAGAAITDATVALEGNMNHAGMVPVLADAVTDDADGRADGHYTLPFEFSMLGDWIVSVTVTQADGSSFTRNLDVRAGSDGIVGDDVLPREGNAATETNAATDSSDTDASATLQVNAAMARPAPLAGGTGAVYFQLHNGGDAPVTLMGAQSPAAAAVELHTTMDDNGVMKMRQMTEGIVLGPGESVELTPGAMHMMLVDLAAPLMEGDTISMTLHFDGADDLTFDVPVMSMDDLPEEGDMPMDHQQ